MKYDPIRDAAISRRHLLKYAAGATAAGALAWAGGDRPAGAEPTNEKEERNLSLNGRINHSIVQWCFQKYWEPEQTCQVAKQLGCQSVELLPPEHWPTLKKHGIVCAIASSHSFVQGMNNPKYHEMCQSKIRTAIDHCADAGFSNVITFTGFAEDTGPPADGRHPNFDKLPPNRPAIDPEEGIKNCVEGFKQIVGYAEQKKVTISLEMLNSRVNIEMKGHPGYQGDHIDYCLRIINAVGSPRFGLLFDIYHVQIMDGDLITRVHECKDVITHVHTAGNPGRRELDGQQEINYAPVMQALVDIGYKGYVGHEFIPTRDPLEGLREAVAVCDV